MEIWTAIDTIISQKRDQRSYWQVVEGWLATLEMRYDSSYPLHSEAAAEAIRNATTQDAEAYKHRLENSPGTRYRFSNKAPEKAAGATVAKRLRIIRGIYNKLHGLGIISFNPFCLIQIPKQESNQKRPSVQIPTAVVRKILRKSSWTDRAVQKRAIFSALLAGGLRRSELLQLKLDDICYTEDGIPHIYLRDTKSGKDHMQVLPIWADSNIRDWIQRRRDAGAEETDLLFVSFGRDGVHRETLNPTTLNRWIKNWLAKFGLNPRHFSAHSARNTAICKLFDDGLDLYSVQQFARHSQPKTTTLYDVRRKNLSEAPGLKIRF